MLALLPLLLSAGMGMSVGETPPLDRTGTLRHPLQFARYCHNYGREPIAPTAVLSSRFQFRNAGDSVIQLGDIERSCGCLTPQLSHRQLNPGEVGELTVSVPLTEQTAGPHEFQLTVHYSDPQPRHETVLIKAVFPEPEIHVTPRAIEVSQQGRSDQSMTHHFTITDRRERPLRVESVESSSPWVTGSVAAKESDGEVIRIAMQLEGTIPDGTHHVLMQAVTSDPKFPVVLMPIRLRGHERQETVIVSPSMLRMHAADSSPQSVVVQIPADWQVSHADSFPAQLRCEWHPVSQPSAVGPTAAASQQIRLDLRMMAAPAYGTREGVVTLYANDASEMLTVRVEILGAMQRRNSRQEAPADGDYSTN